MHRFRYEILGPIVMPFIRRHPLMFQHDNARPRVVRICTQFLEAENVPVLPRPAYAPDMSPIKHFWDALDRCVRQRVSVPTNIHQLGTAIEEEWDNILLDLLDLLDLIYLYRNCTSSSQKTLSLIVFQII